MRLVARNAPLSRAAIAAQSGLTRATVSAIVDELIAGGLVTEVSPPPPNGAGRPATGVVLSGATPAGLGMEINVDYLAACVLDLAGTVRHRAHLTADQRGRTPSQTWAGLGTLARAAHKAAVAQGLSIAGAMVALPGLVSEQTVRIAPNLGWTETPIPAHIDGVPLSGGNEANLAALGELHTLPGSEPSSFVYVSGEIGIGAGLVVNGQLFTGTQGWAGELGHVTVDPAGPDCTCGSRGCLEQYAGEDAIRSLSGLPSADLPRAAADGSPPVLAALAQAGTALGVALSSAVNLLDLPCVVLGSHLAPLAPWLSPAIEHELQQRVLTSRWSTLEVRPSALGADAAIIGAARTVTNAIITSPAPYLASR